MPVIIGKKPIIETKPFEDFALGLSLPIQIGNTAFNQNFKTIDQIRSNIRNLLLTKRGERLMQPNFGSGLQELLFEFEDDNFSEKIETAITNAVTQWIPNVEIDQIEVDISDALKDTNTVNVKLTFRVAGTNNTGVLDLNLSEQQI